MNKNRKFVWYAVFSVVLCVFLFAWFGAEVALCGGSQYSEVDSILAAIMSVCITDQIVGSKDMPEGQKVE